jgi:nucleotide-binding universal stress UspA family protein
LRRRLVFKIVIVPLDGSVTAETALPYAEEFATRTGTELILLAVREANDFRSENMLQAYLDIITKKVKEGTKTFLMEPGAKELKASNKILTGNPAEEILKFSESQEGSHIIMATHGQSGFGTPWTLGSVAHKVIHSATHPVTLISAKRFKPATHGKGIQKTILATVDGTKAGEVSLPYVKEMAQILKAEVVFLHIMTKELVTYKMIEVPVSEEKKKFAREYLSRLVDDMKASGISARYIIEETRGDIGGEIVEYTEKNYVPLIVMSAYGRPGLKYWGIGSVTDKVINEAPAPVMIIKASRIQG